MKNIHLICNAHLDPVWLWEWEEGAAEALSTFRVAADFCENYEGFVFNHNEVILYQWVEEYEPALFERIRKLVQEGKWHIMGGWYLQPDCNMPSGESFVRQILSGRFYFKEKFGVEPTTAINFDPFGHTRGLVQILKKSGYDSYIFCRPDQKDCALPGDDFIWVGYDGSEVIGHRAFNLYLSARGEADSKVRKWMENNEEKQEGLVLWGIGNHGGGPSRIDLQRIEKLREESESFNIMHSVPEAYFKDMINNGTSLKRHEKDLNAWAVGCYTSQIRIKQKHRQLENELYMLEKMVSSAALQGYMTYPEKEIKEALKDLLTAEFHDILPGSSIQPVEEMALRLMDHGLELVSRLKAKAFFQLAQGQEKAKEGEIPVLVYNPHPFKVNATVECEFQLPDQNWKEEFSLPVVYKNGKRIPSQAEKEQSNLNLDWRKRVVFQAELEPGQMNRFDCQIEVLKKKPSFGVREEQGVIHFKTERLKVVINCSTGLIDRYVAAGVDYLKKDSFLPIVMEDNDDSWGMLVDSYRNHIGSFKLMEKEEGSLYSGVKGAVLESVRVIEDGAVRTVVEAVFFYGNSFLCQTYKLPKEGTEIQVQIRVNWNEKSKMLKLSVPTVFEAAKYLGQVAFGTEELPSNGKEVVAQKWTGVFSEESNHAFTCINEGVYGSDFSQGEMRISLLRSPGYSGHPIEDRPIMETDRFSPRIDQGERLYNFWFSGGAAKERLDRIDREALIKNERPFSLSFFPSGQGKKPMPLILLEDDIIQLSAFKKSEAEEAYIVRIFNPVNEPRSTTLRIPFYKLEEEIELTPFEVRTFKVNENIIEPVNLVEKRLE